VGRGGEVRNKPIPKPPELRGRPEELAVGGSLHLGVRQWMSSFLGTEKPTYLAWATALKRPKIDYRALELERYKGEDVVMEKSCT